MKTDNYSQKLLRIKVSFLNPFQPSVVFHIETNHLICIADQKTVFYMKYNTGLKWVNSFMTKETKGMKLGENFASGFLFASESPRTNLFDFDFERT